MGSDDNSTTFAVTVLRHRWPAVRQSAARDAPASGPRPRLGVTLIELIAVLAVLGVMGTVVALSLRRGERHTGDHVAATIAAARREALRLRHPVTVEIRSEPYYPSRATAMPDGRIVADSAVGGHSMTAITNVR